MHLNRFFVEGDLDTELLNAVVGGSPPAVPGGSKNVLKRRALEFRKDNRAPAGYLRDRDFDFDPPADLTQPTADALEKGSPFGWRWCRHEIENYLLDPTVVAEATGWPTADYEAAVRTAAASIREYQAARWTVGVVRRSLPPHYELRTRPDGLNEIDLPQLTAGAVTTWAADSIAGHHKVIAAATDSANVQTLISRFTTRFDAVFVADVPRVLVSFSGKDLFAGLADWLVTKGVANPGAFRALLRDWMIDNPDRVLELLPEWKRLVELLRA